MLVSVPDPMQGIYRDGKAMSISFKPGKQFRWRKRHVHLGHILPCCCRDYRRSPSTSSQEPTWGSVLSVLLQIAHRLESVMGCDQVAVMDIGRVMECGPPAHLLGDEKSHFSALHAKA